MTGTQRHFGMWYSMNNGCFTLFHYRNSKTLWNVVHHEQWMLTLFHYRNSKTLWNVVHHELFHGSSNVSKPENLFTTIINFDRNGYNKNLNIPNQNYELLQSYVPYCHNKLIKLINKRFSGTQSLSSLGKIYVTTCHLL